MQVRSLFLSFCLFLLFFQILKANDQQIIYDTSEDPQRHFTMVIPSDWKSESDHMGYELFLEPKKKLQPTEAMPLVANPNLTVKVLMKPVFIDEKSLEDYKLEIEKNLKQTLGEESGVNVFQTTLFPLEEGRSALVYDISFFRGENEVYQTIVVTSDSKRLFRATLTDFKIFYMKNREKLFPYMVSMSYEGPAPLRPHFVQAYGLYFALAFLFLLILVFLIYYRKKQQKLLMSEVLGEESSFSGGDDSGETFFESSSASSSQKKDEDDSFFKSNY